MPRCNIRKYRDMRSRSSDNKGRCDGTGGCLVIFLLPLMYLFFF